MAGFSGPMGFGKIHHRAIALQLQCLCKFKQHLSRLNGQSEVLGEGVETSAVSQAIRT